MRGSLMAALGLLAASTSAVFAIEQIEVLALFKNKALLLVDGERRLLAAGELSPEGVRLIESNPQRAVLEVDGVRGDYPLGSRISTRYVERGRDEALVYADAGGSFTTTGAINGLTVNMVVDTGAFTVAINALEAKRLGIAYRLEGTPIQVATASGPANAFQLRFDRVKVGDIIEHNVDGVVIEGAYPQRVLLGMSFLKRVEMVNEGRVLRLRSRF